VLRPLITVLALAVPLLAGPAQAADPDPVRGLTQGLDTMERRELRMDLADLDGAQRARAAAALARPSASRHRDFARVRVHWSPGEATSAYVKKVGTISDRILKTYQQAGYRSPLPDGTRGGNRLLDIYLEDLGGQGLYGYCDSDKRLPASGPFDAWAYCGFDNDYREFPAHTPLQNLQVTAAHELFHAVQFAYDYLEDSWFMEATATWAEDELYDGVDDNLQYLEDSPLADPARSMDQFDDSSLWQYGDWIFFRYLTETYPASRGGMATLVRDMWTRADGDANGPDNYSIQAVETVLAGRGTSLPAEWAAFAAANRRPASTYDEGAANDYPSVAPARTVALSAKSPDSGIVTRTVDHLAAATVRFTRPRDLDATSLELTLDLPALDRGSGAVATVYGIDGEATVVPLPLSSSGNAVTTVDFGRDVSGVEVTLANAGTDYDCWLGTDWSCRGRSNDDGLQLKVRAEALS
jgi:hypothetical protein